MASLISVYATNACCCTTHNVVTIYMHTNPHLGSLKQIYINQGHPTCHSCRYVCTHKGGDVHDRKKERITKKILITLQRISLRWL